MTDTSEDLVLDPDGIPILTNLIQEDATPYSAEAGQEFPYNKLSIEELTGLMLGSETFTQQLRTEFGQHSTLKIIASSATIEAFERQVEHLYGRDRSVAQ